MLDDRSSSHPADLGKKQSGPFAFYARGRRVVRNATHVAPVLPEGGTWDQSNFTSREVLPRRAQ